MSKLNEMKFKSRKPSKAPLNGWKTIEGKLIEREFKFGDFAEALAFVNRVGSIAEKENHHPDILIHGWNKVKISLSTHSAGGLIEKDYVVAEKIDGIIKG